MRCKSRVLRLPGDKLLKLFARAYQPSFIDKYEISAASAAADAFTRDTHF